MRYFIAGNFRPLSYIAMFDAYGHTLVAEQKDADFVLFTGGEDVHPRLYREGIHPLTGFNGARDSAECRVFNRALRAKQPMIGICRGAQLLNVLSGGKLWQDVNNHAVWGRHHAVDSVTGEVVDVTSTHHQMMRAGKKGHVFLTANNIASYKERCTRNGIIKRCTDDKVDVEGVYYPNTASLCIQGHPEKVSDLSDRWTQYFFEVVERYHGIPSVFKQA